jgi:hypothetical protein
MQMPNFAAANYTGFDFFHFDFHLLALFISLPGISHPPAG